MKAGVLAIIPLLCALTNAAAPLESDAFFTQYSAASFRKLPEVNEPINLQRPNRPLLEAAVFHETNRRRTRQGLRALHYDSKVHQAAKIQSQHMAEISDVTHENPNRNAADIVARIRLAGLPRPAFAAENVASAFGRRYRSGDKFYVREESGRRIYSHEPNGPPIPMHTYASFARALVDSWMQSPGHRRNILARDVAYLGCACVRSRDPTPMETLYCTQVFFRPLE